MIDGAALSGPAVSGAGLHGPLVSDGASGHYHRSLPDLNTGSSINHYRQPSAYTVRARSTKRIDRFRLRRGQIRFGLSLVTHTTDPSFGLLTGPELPNDPNLALLSSLVVTEIMQSILSRLAFHTVILPQAQWFQLDFKYRYGKLRRLSVPRNPVKRRGRRRALL